MPETKNPQTKKWEGQIGNFLNGKTIETVRYMTDEEQERFMWGYRALIIFFTDGSYIFPSADDEGNDAGALFTSEESLPIIPVMR